jgi:hypothetical protein
VPVAFTVMIVGARTAKPDRSAPPPLDYRLILSRSVASRVRAADRWVAHTFRDIPR